MLYKRQINFTIYNVKEGLNDILLSFYSDNVNRFSSHDDGNYYISTYNLNISAAVQEALNPNYKINYNSNSGKGTIAKQTVTIAADGSRVVTYNYSRNKYKFTLGSHQGINTSGSTGTGSYYYGSTITLKTSPTPGYTWNKWSDGNTSQSFTTTMSASALTLTPSENAITYRIQYLTYGGAVTGNPVTYNVETPTFILKNPIQLGMTFTGWSDRNNSSSKTEYIIQKGAIGDITVSANWAPTDTEYGRSNSNNMTSNKFTVK